VVVLVPREGSGIIQSEKVSPKLVPLGGSFLYFLNVVEALARVTMKHGIAIS